MKDAALVLVTALAFVAVGQYGADTWRYVGDAWRQQPGETELAYWGMRIGLPAALIGVVVAIYRHFFVRNQNDTLHAKLDRLLAASTSQTTEPQKAALIEALASAEAAVAAGSDWMARARASLADGRIEDAVILFEEEASEKEAMQEVAAADAATAFRHLGAIVRLKDPRKARFAFGKATALDPNDTESLVLYGALFFEAGSLDESKTAYRKVLARGNAGIDPRDSFWAGLGLGDIAMARGNIAEAGTAYDTAAALATQQAKADPGNAGWRRDFSVSHDKVGDVLVAQGKLPDALTRFEAGLDIAEKLAGADPGNAGWQADPAATSGKLGGILKIMDQPERALAMFEKGRALVAPLAERSEVLQWKNYLNSFNAEIAALRS